jgi:hypothetical protein
MCYLGRLMYIHGLLGVLWPLVFSKELSQTYDAAEGLEEGGGEAGDGDAQLARLVQQIAQNVEQGIRVKSTAEWLAANAAADLGLARVWHEPMMAMTQEMIFEASHEWELKQRVKLDDEGNREFRVTNAARGTLHLRCLAALARIMQSPVSFALYVYWVGTTGQAAFQAWRIGASLAARLFLRFELRRRAHPLKSFELVKEGLPDGTAEALRLETACMIIQQ